MKNSAFRKGAWDGEEDLLLRKCIETYGEGNWHQIPQRAGLNRCRKSCRLRWLNYLSPNINREEFKEDEIDLIFKLHKLLGNRWSLIAGRLPGRTANDIKNFWNSHLSKRLDAQHPNDLRSKPKKFNIKTFRSRSVPLCGLRIPENLQTEKQDSQHPNVLTSKPQKVEVIRPRPRVFRPRSVSLETFRAEDQLQPQQQVEEQEQPKNGRQHGLLLPNEAQTMWWKDLVFYDEDMSQSSLVAMKEGSSSDPAMETTVAMDSENIIFGNSSVQWDDDLFLM